MSAGYADAVRTLIRCVGMAAALAGAAWWYWRSRNQDNAEAWAAATDRVSWDEARGARAD